MDPSLVVRIRRDDGQKRFVVRIGNSEEVYDSRQIIHVRGWTPFLGVDEAPSPIWRES